MKPILETSRRALREMTPADLDFVAAMLADPEVMRFYPKCYSRDEAAEWLARQMQRYQRHGHGLWLTIDKTSGQAVGQVGLSMQQIDGMAEPEVGYLIHRPYWRRGFAAEAAAASRDYAFEKLNKARVISLIRPLNIPSQRVALRIGMKPEKLTTYANLEHLVFSISRSAAAL